MEQNSVNTAPQPPSAFMPRKCAWAPGLSAPGPAQCEVCQNRLRSFFGPILIGSNNTSCFGSRDIFHPPGVSHAGLGTRGYASLLAHATLLASVYTWRQRNPGRRWSIAMIFTGKVVLV